MAVSGVSDTVSTVVIHVHFWANDAQERNTMECYPEEWWNELSGDAPLPVQ